MKKEQLREKLAQILINGKKEMCEANIILKDFLPFDEVSKKQVRKFIGIAKKRCKNIPLQYLLKTTSFLGVVIRCNRNVLIPRPETELMTDTIIKNEKEIKNVLDLCCGSGCIGLAIKKAKNIEVDLADISSKAIKEVKRNAVNNDLNVNIIKSDLFDKISSKYDLIVSNPPYIKTEDLKNLQPEVKKEPKVALNGGKEGYDFYVKIIKDAPKFLNIGGKIYFEIGQGQDKEVIKLLKKGFKEITVIKDYNNIDRIICGTLI